MMRKANKTKIGIFVVGAVVLLVAAILIFGSGALFGQSDKYIVFFNGSVKGLSVGAPVNFRGVKIGNVTGIDLAYDLETKEVLIPVVIDVELARVKGIPDPFGYPDYAQFIQDGLRAKLELQNFITGQLMLGFDFYPQDPKKMYNIAKAHPELPALPISPDIFEVMNQIPIKEITSNLAQAVSGINRLINSEGIAGLDKTVREITQSARSFGLLVEYLELHPEALLRGKSFTKGE
ncbi:MAG TPA: MlaD family protein [Candidatus Omnitrophota bacterium]|nr:MlaD family protein [Candidatus Omnitrophota bacterium]